MVGRDRELGTLSRLRAGRRRRALRPRDRARYSRRREEPPRPRIPCRRSARAPRSSAAGACPTARASPGSRRGTAPLGGRARRRGRNLPGHGRACANASRGDEDADAILARLAEPLGDRIEPAPIEELFWAIRRFLERLATARPRSSVLDDLQWAEPDHPRSRGAPRRLGPRRPARPAGDGAPRAPRPPVGWGGGKPDATTFLLEPLPTAETGTPRRGAVGRARRSPTPPGSASPPPPTATRCTSSRSSRCCSTTASFSGGPDGALVVGDLETISVPPTIQALLAARLDRLERWRAADDRASRRGRQGVRPARRLRADAHRRPRGRVRPS